MSSAKMFDIYRKPQFDETLQKIETRTYYPYVKSFNNNDVVEITINQGDSWITMYDAAIFIEGKLTKTVGDGKVGFVHNAGAFLFDMVSYDLNGKEVDSVRDPGIVSTIKGFLCYNSNDTNHMNIAGWNYPDQPIVATNGLFVFRIPLHHFLGLFNDYQLAQFGKHTIRLVRSRNDNDSIIIEEVAAPQTATKAELIIENISLKVNVVFPNDMLKLKLLESIKSDKPIIIPFRKWEYHELPQLTQGATKEIWAVKTCTALETPRFVILAFQTDKRSKNDKNPTEFDNLNVSDVRIILNGEYYPNERMRLSFDTQRYTEAHYNYTRFYQSFKNDFNTNCTPLLDYNSFINHALFVIDCSKRNTPIKSGTIDIKVDIESGEGFPANTKAYCIIIHDNIMEHLPLSEIVRSLM